MADNILQNVAEAVKYFGKKKAGQEPTVDKFEQAAGINPPTPPPPPSEGKSHFEGTPRVRYYKE